MPHFFTCGDEKMAQEKQEAGMNEPGNMNGM
jgi:hypothetical protein